MSGSGHHGRGRSLRDLLGLVPVNDKGEREPEPAVGL